MKENAFIKLKKKYAEKQMLYKTVFIWGVVLILTVVASGVIFFSYFEKTLSNYLERDSSQRLDKIRLSIDTFILEANRLGYKMENNSQLTRMRIQTNPIETVQLFNMYKNVNTAISEVIIYYGNDESFLTTNGTMSSQAFRLEYPDFDLLIDTIRSTNKPGFYNSSEFDYENYPDQILYMLPVPYSNSEPTLIYIFVFDTSVFRSLMTSDLGDAEMVFIYDNGNKLILSGDKRHEVIGKDISSGSLFPSNNKLTLNGIRYSYMKIKASNGISIVRLMNEEVYLSPITAAQRTFLALTLSLLAFGLVLVVYAIRSNYKPIRQLLKSVSNPVEKKTTMTHMPGELLRIKTAFDHVYQENADNKKKLEDHIPALYDHFVMNAIKGRYVDVEELNDACRSLDIRFSYQYYCVCAILLDDDSPGNNDALKTKLYNVFQSIMPETTQVCLYSSIDELSLYGILCFSNPNNEQLNAQLNLFRNEVYKRTGINLTISFGEIYDDVSSLGKSYIGARFALNYRFIEGTHTVISSKMISSSLNSPMPYPYSELLYYQEIISRWNPSEIDGALSKIVQKIKQPGVSLYIAKCICFDIISVFVKEANHVNRSMAVDLSRYFDLFSISDFSCIAELVSTISLFVGKIYEFIEENNNTIHSSMKQKYINYLDRNIGNYQFSIDNMARDFFISPQYLRKSFKEMTGSPLLEYYNNIRLDRAKDLLVTTNMDTMEIIKNLGYIDASSFIRKFRSMVGLTPKEYRKKYRK